MPWPVSAPRRERTSPLFVQATLRLGPALRPAASPNRSPAGKNGNPDEPPVTAIERGAHD